jgi:multisubunit Na+/H+ antiporter MnhF subunit
MNKNVDIVGTNGIARFKGLGFSLLLSAPLSYLFYFVIGSAHQIKSDTIPLIVGVTILLVISTHAFMKPAIYLKFAEIVGVIGFLGTIIGAILSFFSIFS